MNRHHRLVAVLAASMALFPAAVIRAQLGNEDSTLTRQYREADAAVLAKRVAVHEPNGKDDLGSTTYEIVQIPRSSEKSLTKGMRITIPEKRGVGKGGLVLLLGKRADADKISWRIPQEIDSRRYNYLTHAPAPEADVKAKLLFYVSRLEDADDILAADAFTQVQRAPQECLVALADKLPRDDLRTWIDDPELPPSRLGLYALMLGMCGDEEDAEWMEAKILEESTEFRLEISGIMQGFLMLTGDRGLEVLEKSTIANADAVFSETYSAMMALRFMWSHGNGKISAARLKQSMHLLLDRPEMSDVVIADLARWKDWSVQERLRNLYGAEDYNLPSIKRAIVRYMIASTDDISEKATEDPPKHAAEGKRFLEELRTLDPKTVNAVERNVIRK